MADLKAQLELSADASGVETGVANAKKSLASLGASAATAGRQASDGLAQAGNGGDQAAAKVDRATSSIIGSIQRATAVAQAGGRGTAAYFEAIAAQRGISSDALKPYLDQLDAAAVKTRAATVAAQDFSRVTTSLGATSFAKPLGNPTTSLGASGFGASGFGAIASEAAAASNVATQALGKIGLSANELKYAMRGVPAQFTDIFTSLASGQRPLQVFLQQGGQLKDMFGGAGPAARALGGYVLGLINPFTIAATAAAALAYAYNVGAKEGDAYTHAIILSGNSAGVTAGQLQAMAQSISKVAGTQHNAADAIAQFAQAGDVAGSNLEKVSLAAIKFERATGQAVSETVKQFSELAKAPLDASVKLNSSMHYLTLSTYAQIKALQDQGRETDAAALAQKTYADAIDSRSGQIEAKLGTIERAWKAIKDATLGAADAALGIGRAISLQDQLSAALQKRADLEARGALAARGGRRQSTTDAEVAENNALINSLSRRAIVEGDVAAATKAASDQVQARISFDKQGEQVATNATKREREITQARIIGAAAGATQVEIEKRIADIRQKYADKKGPKDQTPLIDKAQLGSDIDAIKRASDQLVGIYSNQEKVLEAQRSAGGLSDAAYYQKKRELIITESEIQDYALQQQIKRYQAESLSGKEAIENQKKIVATESELARLRDATATKLTVLSIDQEGAAKRLALSFLTARQAAQDYFDSVNKQQARDLGSVGQGAQARTLNNGISQIEDRYAGQKRDLENQKAQLELEGKFTDDARKQYEERLRIITEFQDKSVSSYTGYYQKLIALQGDASLGAKEALQNYYDDANALGKLTEGAVTRSLSSIEDAFVQLATTGKVNFKSLADSIIADIIRIQVKAAIAQLVGNGSSGGLIASLLSAFASSSGGGAGFYLGSGAGASTVGMSLDTGTNYVPYDGFKARLHKGEAVVPAKFNPALAMAGQDGGGGRKVTINNYAGAEVSTKENDRGDLEVVIEAAARRGAALAASQVASGRGDMAKAMRDRGINLDRSNPRKN